MSTAKSKSILYLLTPGFADPATGPAKFYCPYCMRIEGMLSVFPVLRHALDIRYVDFAKPRGNLADYAGPGSQSCPQLIFLEEDDEVSKKWSAPGQKGSRRMDKTSEICEYFSERFALPIRHP